MAKKYSFRARSKELIDVLESKKQTEEMSDLINEALVFYLRYSDSLPKMEKTLAKIAEKLDNSISVQPVGNMPGQEEESKINQVDLLLQNSLAVFK